MPTETGTAFLIDPNGHAPEVIDGAVHEVLLRYLNLPEGSPACEAVEWLLHRATETPGLDDKEVLGQSLWHYTNTFDHSLAAGVLASIHGTGQVEDLTEEETEILQDTLTAIRVGGWFPRWLALQVGTIANRSGIPDDQHPTPLKIAASLVNDIQEHEEKMEAAREMVRMHPHLLFPAPAEPPATPEPPQAVETTQPATKHPAKSQRARKPRKKVAHA
jgi:hypothetical protein